MKVLLLLILALLPGAARTAEVPDAARVAALVERLGDEDFAVRERAEEELLAIGEQVVKLLRPFRDDPNPETRQRVKRLLGQLEIQGNELAWIDPKHEGDRAYWSEMGGPGMELVFKNLSRKPVRIYWLEPDGSRRSWRGVLKAGEETVCERSYLRHTWVITDLDEKALGLYRIDREKPVLVVRDRG